MKNIFILLAILVCLVSCSESVAVIDVRGASLEELNTEETKDTILVIDTRPYSEYKISHIANAINIPKNEIKTRKNEFEDWKEKPIYIYANNDDESFEAAKILVASGCKIIYNAEGLSQYSYKTIKYDCIRGIVFEQNIASPDAVIIDCRLKSSYTTGHIKGAISIPLVELEEHIDTLPKNKKIFLYCNVGTASARAAAILSAFGFNEIYNSIDGILEYQFKSIETTAKD